MLKWNPSLEARYTYPTPAETIGLAKRAVHHGMTLKSLPGGVHCVNDPTTGRRHFVTAVSCDCWQFIGSGSAGCQHLALLQVEKGWIPEAVAIMEDEAR